MYKLSSVMTLVMMVLATAPIRAGIITTNLTLNYDAALDTPGDAVWENEQSSVKNFTFASNISPINVSDGLFDLTKAYRFPKARAAGGALQTLPGDPTKESATFEIVFRTPDLSGNHVLFETGGNGNGTAFLLEGDQLIFRTQMGGDAIVLSFSGLSTGEFNQFVGTIDLDGNVATLYHNGELVAQDTGNITDWGGADMSGLGRRKTSVAGNGSFTAFNGAIAILRFYEEALTGTEVKQNFDAITKAHSDVLTNTEELQNFEAITAVPEPATLALFALGLAGLGLNRHQLARDNNQHR